MWHAAHSQTSPDPKHRPVPPRPVADHSSFITRHSSPPHSIAGLCRVFRDHKGQAAGLPFGQTDGRRTRSQILIASPSIKNGRK